MLSHDELTGMSNEEKMEYLESEVEKVIQSAEPKNQLGLRALQARMKGIRRKIKDPYHCAHTMFVMMVQHTSKLNKILNGKD